MRENRPYGSEGGEGEHPSRPLSTRIVAPKRTLRSIRATCANTCAVLVGLLAILLTPALSAEITLIHMGDVHGHLLPRPSVRGETPARSEGGLARMYTKISEIRAQRG